MGRSTGDLKSRVVRLRRKYFGDVVYIGLHIAFFGAIAWFRDSSGELSWMELYAFLGPVAFGWALTGSARYGGWGSGLFLGSVLFIGEGWVASLVDALAFFRFGWAAVIAADRADGWTFRGAVRSVLVKVGQWLQVQLPVVGQVSAVGFDRPNTFGENFVMALVWVSVLGLSFWPAAVVGDFFLSISAAMEGAVGAER